MQLALFLSISWVHVYIRFILISILTVNKHSPLFLFLPTIHLVHSFIHLNKVWVNTGNADGSHTTDWCICSVFCLNISNQTLKVTMKGGLDLRFNSKIWLFRTFLSMRRIANGKFVWGFFKAKKILHIYINGRQYLFLHSFSNK